MGDNPQFTTEAFIVSVLAGGIGGMACEVAIFPIDSIKTRIQASDKGKDFVKQAEEVSKFTGLFSAMAASFPCTAMFWLAYEYCKYIIHTTEFLQSNLHVVVQLVIIASVASFCESLVRNPFEVVKQNM